MWLGFGLPLQMIFRGGWIPRMVSSYLKKVCGSSDGKVYYQGKHIHSLHKKLKLYACMMHGQGASYARLCSFCLIYNETVLIERYNN